ncbi:MULTISPECIES: J domain-containing protein [Synechococcales]|uniref:J domain-containing protein n=1 Tax=Synechococcus sp. CS-1325 TaxID=2847979 RepID=UPI00223ABDA2|nr:J domain-containing protein [Synechococcus sp. CS-1325]
MVNEPENQNRRRLSIDLPVAWVEEIDRYRREWGYRSRGPVLERLLDQLFKSEEELAEQGAASLHEPLELDERGALVLAANTHQAELVFDDGFPDLAEDGPLLPHPTSRSASIDSKPSSDQRRRSVGIDLPGFVRQRSDRLRQSLHPARSPAEQEREPLPQLAPVNLEEALTAAGDHWLSLYGTEANAAVLEAAMVWLGQEIWPQSDQSDGRPFTWSLAERWILGVVPSWPLGPPSFARVIVVAGLLEDPFSTGTLTLRLPTLIRRFVHRFRRQHRGTSFQTLEHTMTLHGALRQLQLPTDHGQRFTLDQIREAYREQALSHHPDAGGSADAMRRLNEAYQLLKELYRKPSQVAQ